MRVEWFKYLSIEVSTKTRKWASMCMYVKGIDFSSVSKGPGGSMS